MEGDAPSAPTLDAATRDSDTDAQPQPQPQIGDNVPTDSTIAGAPAVAARSSRSKRKVQPSRRYLEQRGDHGGKWVTSQ